MGWKRKRMMSVSEQLSIRYRHVRWFQRIVKTVSDCQRILPFFHVLRSSVPRDVEFIQCRSGHSATGSRECTSTIVHSLMVPDLLSSKEHPAAVNVRIGK
jgi:hypothetical protein